MKRVLIALALLATSGLVVAEVSIIRGGESTDPGGQQSQIIIKTGDRAIVPAITQTNETKSDTSTRIETSTRVRDANGNYVEWQRASDVVREVAPGKFERTTEVVERDRQGGERERRQIQQSTAKSEAGETTKTSEFRRDTSGKMVLARDGSSISTKNIDGSVVTSAIVNDYDVNGKAAVTRQIDGTTTTSNDGRTQTTTSTIKSIDHLHGNIGATDREVVSVQNDPNTTRSETVTQRPTTGGWEDASRTQTIETRNADGTVQRETVIQSRSLYAGGATTTALTPQTKTIERQVRQPDGTIVIQRDDYRRDVNGEWKPMTFSTEAAKVGSN